MEPDESEKYDKSIHHPERGIGVAKPSFNDHHRLKWFAPGHGCGYFGIAVLIVIFESGDNRKVASGITGQGYREVQVGMPAFNGLFTYFQG